MGFTIKGNPSLESVAGTRPVSGTFNSSPASIIVHRQNLDPFSGKRMAVYFGDLKHSNIAVCLGVDTKQFKGVSYNIYGFEASEKSIMDFKFVDKPFGFTQSIIQQCLDAIDHAHSIDYVVDDLDHDSTFLFYQAEGSVTVKLAPYKCHPGSSKDLPRRKADDIKKFAILMTKFFFGRKVTVEEAILYDPDQNKPAIRFIPSFSPIYDTERAYTVEVRQFIKAASSVSEKDKAPASKMMKNDPVLWGPGKRLGLVQDGWESVSKFSDDAWVVKEIDKCFSGEKYWRNFPNTVRRDLVAPEPWHDNETSTKTAAVPGAPGPKEFQRRRSSYGTDAMSSAVPGAPGPKEFQRRRSSCGTDAMSSAVQGAPGPKEFQRRRSSCGTDAMSSAVQGAPGPKEFQRRRSSCGTDAKTAAVPGAPGPKEFKRRRSSCGMDAMSSAVQGDAECHQNREECLQPKRGSGCDFLRTTRNLIVHRLNESKSGGLKGAESYGVYDTDVRKGLDLLLSVKLPTFFMAVHDVLRRARDLGLMDPGMDCYLDPTHDQRYS